MPFNHVYYGKEDKLNTYIDRMFDDDAAGEVLLIKRENGQATMKAIVPLLYNREEMNREIEEAEIIIVDGGNSAGDSWKYIYHRKAEEGIFIVETSQ